MATVSTEDAFGSQSVISTEDAFGTPRKQARPISQSAVDDTPEWAGKYPNLYGIYGAAKETAKGIIPYTRYLDPADREAFLKKDTQGQTRELLWELAGAELELGLAPIAKGLGAIAGPALERAAPKVYKALTKERFVSKPKAVTPTEKPSLKETVTSEEMGLVETAPVKAISSEELGFKPTIEPESITPKQPDIPELNPQQLRLARKTLPYYPARQPSPADIELLAEANKRGLLDPQEQDVLSRIIGAEPEIQTGKPSSPSEIVPPEPNMSVKPETPVNTKIPKVKPLQQSKSINLIGRINELGGINAGEQYNTRLLRQDPDGKRILSKSGKSPDEMAATLNDEGYNVGSGDDLMELVKAGKGREIYNPVKADDIINKKIIKEEVEWADEQVEALDDSFDFGANVKQPFKEETGTLEGMSAEENFSLTPGKGKVGDKPLYGKKEQTAEMFNDLDRLAETQRAEAQRGSVQIGKGEKQANPVKIDNPEIEARFSAANGIPQETAIQKVKRILTDVAHKFSREYEHLPKTKENAQLRFTLKNLEKQKDISKDTAIHQIGEITAALDRPSYDIFRRKVIYDDLMQDAEKGRELPFGFTKEILAAEKQKIDTLAGSSPEITKALAKRKAIWDGMKKDYTEAMDSIGFDVKDRFTNENYFRHQVLEYANLDGIFGTGKRLKTPTQRGFLKQRQGSAKGINTDYLQAEYEVMAQMHHDIKLAKYMKEIQKNYDIRPSLDLKAKAAGKKWDEVIPEGYTTWQPREGNVFYMADSIPSKLAQDVQAGIVKEISGEDIKKVLAMGGKRPEWVVKEEVADTLNEIVKQRADSTFLEANRKIQGAWKQWQLIQPRRWFKYNTRNMTGDAEAVFVGNPSAFRKTPQAVKEIYDVFFRKKSMSPEMAEWFKRGGMSSTLQAQEMGQLKSLWMFKHLHEKSGKLSDIPANLWAKYWNAARLTTDAREAVLRYSAYLDYLEQMQKSGGIPKNFGASIKREIMGLEDVRDRAFWLSNDLLGAYDRVSVAGQAMREHTTPFWSWQEVNMKRYKNEIINAASDHRLASVVGKRLGAKSALAAVKVGKFVLMASGFAAALQVYNNTAFPEEEKAVPKDVRQKPHIILGKDKEGNVLYFSRIGILGDALSWFGVDGAQKEVRQYLNGEKSLTEAAKGMAKEIAMGPANVLWSGSFPFAKPTMEAITRRSTYPDLRKQSTIRDRGIFLARSLGLESEYKALTGKPSEGYGKSLSKVFIYSANPKETAYHEVYDLKREFLKKSGKGAEGFWLTPKGNAAYNVRLAIRYQDKKALEKYMAEYQALGGTDKTLKQSLDRMHPLAGMSKADRKEFLENIKPEDQQRLQDAISFYETVLLGNR